MEYRIFKTTRDELERLVNAMLSKDWVLYGHPFLSGTKHKIPGEEVPEPIICQAMIRDIKKKKAKKKS